MGAMFLYVPLSNENKGTGKKLNKYDTLWNMFLLFLYIIISNGNNIV